MRWLVRGEGVWGMAGGGTLWSAHHICILFGSFKLFRECTQKPKAGKKCQRKGWERVPVLTAPPSLSPSLTLQWQLSCNSNCCRLWSAPVNMQQDFYLNTTPFLNQIPTRVCFVLSLFFCLLFSVFFVFLHSFFVLHALSTCHSPLSSLVLCF